MESIISAKPNQYVVAAQYYQITYNDEVYERLCNKFENPDQLNSELRKQLEDFAAIWRWHQSQSDSIRRPRDDKLALKRVLKRAQNLHLALKELSNDAMAALDKANDLHETQALVSDS